MSKYSRTISDMAGVTEGLKWMEDLLFRGLTGGAVLITIERERRSTDQNAKLWPMLSDMASQVEWFGKKHTKEQWRGESSMHNISAWPNDAVVCLLSQVLEKVFKNHVRPNFH
jgi:hypothetical protein